MNLVIINQLTYLTLDKMATNCDNNIKYNLAMKIGYFDISSVGIIEDESPLVI